MLLGLLLLAASPAPCDEARHEHDATTRHRFDDVERWVARFDDPARDAWQKPDEVIRFLEVAPGETVADIGAGTGYFSVRLARAVGDAGRVLAVDIEPALVEYIGRRVADAGLEQVRPLRAEPDDPGLGEAAVDLVFVCDTWHHIDDRLRYLDRLAAALRPGGRLAIVDFRKGELPVGPPPGHKLGRADVLAELAEAGWTLARESEALPYQYLLVFTPPLRE